MNLDPELLCSAFAGKTLISRGSLAQVAHAAKALLDSDESAAILIFDNHTSQIVEMDFRGSQADVAQRLQPASPAIATSTEPDTAPGEESARGRGRPKLGVVAREVTLLPRHWDWLAGQSGGASVALRKLVEEARRKDRDRHGQEACYRFMSAMAGDEPCFEEASRALFAGDAVRFGQQIAHWPFDIRTHTEMLAVAAFA